MPAMSGAPAPGGTGFRPQGLSGRGLMGRNQFGELVTQSRGLAGVDNRAQVAAATARAAAARQQRRLQQQQQQLALRQTASPRNYRDARHLIHHRLTHGLATGETETSSMPDAASDLTGRFEALADRSRIRNFSAELNGRTATISGVAADEAARRLAERIVSLEPGIDHVVNRIVVDPSRP